MSELFRLDDFPFHFEIKTRWRDLDAFGHVNNATFATYIEDARISMFERWNLSQTAGKRSVIAASLKLDFKQQLSHPSKIIVGQRISRVGTTSFDIQAVIFKKDAPNSPICETLLTCVCFNYEVQKSVKVYPEIVEDFSV
ncbi:MAG: acyl-CoA thioesterase [Candidatus Marinimicrobia bacterium]|nr:acyl-CoA thioesterase [Candidatus Neomarinimicrobiota bacterium]